MRTRGAYALAEVCALNLVKFVARKAVQDIVTGVASLVCFNI